MFQITATIPADICTGFPITQSVVDGNQEGKIYRFKNNYFIIHKAGFCSFIVQTDCYKELIALFRQANFLKYFHIYNAPAALVDLINVDVGFNCKLRERVQLQYTGQQVRPVKSMEEFYCENVSQSNFDLLSVFQLDLSSKFWNNKEQFISDAMGAVIFNGRHEPVSVCYAAAIAKHRAEVDVFTKEDHRGKGLASLSVSAFVVNCMNKNIVANWDCFKHNPASLNTAESLGFKEKKTYNFMSIYNSKI